MCVIDKNLRELLKFSDYVLVIVEFWKNEEGRRKKEEGSNNLVVIVIIGKSSFNILLFR